MPRQQERWNSRLSRVSHGFLLHALCNAVTEAQCLLWVLVTVGTVVCTANSQCCEGPSERRADQFITFEHSGGVHHDDAFFCVCYALASCMSHSVPHACAYPWWGSRWPCSLECEGAVIHKQRMLDRGVGCMDFCMVVWWAWRMHLVLVSEIFLPLLHDATETN